MAINYSPIGWDVNKYVNPTNMKHMDEDGIKAACDGVDNAVMRSSAGTQIIAAEDDTPIGVKSNSATRSWIQFRRDTNAALGKIGVGAGDLPLYRTSGGTEKEIALMDNVIAKSSASTQKIALTSGSAGTVLQVQSRTSAAWIGYFNTSGTPLGSIGVESNNKPAFYDTASHEIALAENVVKGSNHSNNAGITPYNAASVAGLEIIAKTPSATTPSVSFGIDIANNRLVIYRNVGSGMSLWGLVPINLV